MKNPKDAADWIVHIKAVAQTRDQSAFKALFVYFGPRVKSFLMRSGLEESLAEECMQEVMVSVWRKAHLFDPSKASPGTWIFTIARNRKIDLLRKSSRPEPEDLPWGPEAQKDQHEILELQQDTDRLREALVKLPQKQRDLVERAFLGDISHKEIATETGLPLGTIKSRIRLAIERLRHELGVEATR